MKRKLFTATEVEYINTHYANASTEAIAKALNRPEHSVYGKANRMGLKKSAEYLLSPAGGRIQKGEKIGAATQFKKGQEAFNKGMKQSEYMSADAICKTKATQFKKGESPHNEKYDGYESTIGGYVYVRISKGVKVLKQRKIWEEMVGPIPSNGNIIFKDGNQLNFNLDNLEMLLNTELMELNTIHRYPTEVKKAIRAVSKLNKTIRNYGKE